MIHYLALRKQFRWTLQHDCIMLREAMVPEVWHIKPGIVERRDSWIRSTDAFMKIQTPKFDFSFRAMREGFTNLM